MTAVPVLPVTVDGVAGFELPYAVVVPYSKVTPVEKPFAFTVPLIVAVVVLSADIAFVIAVGERHKVVNVWSLPLIVPPQFVPFTL